MTTQPGERATSPRRYAARLRATEAVRLRITGMTYDAIATQLGYRSRGACFNAISRELRAYRQEPADELRRLEIARLDTALEALWPRVERGIPRAIDSFLRVSQRRAALLGLDAPTRISIDHVREEAQRIRDELVAAGIADENTEAMEIIRMAEQIVMEGRQRWP